MNIPCPPSPPPPTPYLHGCLPCMQGLLHVNVRDHRKQTPLHVAAEKGDDELITFLLEKKADSNVTDLHGNTPLDLAAKNRHETAFDLLLTHSFSSKEDDAVKKTLKRALNPDRVKDDFVKEKLSMMSPFG